MKRILIASALALATAAPALAADLPPPAAAPPRAPVAYIPAAPLFSWTGSDSAGLLFFCTIQGLAEALYYRPKQNCR
jgi:opacity protein-like surface antigen